MSAPVKNETVDGVDVPATTPAWAIKGAAVLLAVAGPALDAWNPWHLSADSAKAAIVCVFVLVAAVAFFGQTALAAVHKYGWSKTAAQAVYAADKDEAKVFLDELRPVAEQAKPVLDAAAAHSGQIAELRSLADEAAVRIRKLEQTPAVALDSAALKAAIVDALTGKPEAPTAKEGALTVTPDMTPQQAAMVAEKTGAQPAEVSTGGTP